MSVFFATECKEGYARSTLEGEQLERSPNSDLDVWTVQWPNVLGVPPQIIQIMEIQIDDKSPVFPLTLTVTDEFGNEHDFVSCASHWLYYFYYC
jgi:hypothetical protein